MIKLYFKQAWALLKENKLYSSIYILGTALAITMVMIVAVFIFIRKGEVYPELNKERMLYVSSLQTSPKDTSDHSMSSSLFSYNTLKEVFYKLEGPEVVGSEWLNFQGGDVITLPDNRGDISANVKYTDANYWKVFTFDFIDGKPFTQEEFESGISTIVISKTLSIELFNETDVAGKYLTLNEKEYKIAGVVKDGSYLLPCTYAKAWVPFSTRADYEEEFDEEGVLGMIRAYILAPSKGDLNKIREELEGSFKKHEANLESRIDLLGQPDDAFASSFRRGNMPLEIGKTKLTFALLIAIFLLVPAINLSGLNSSRLDKRASELGIRKAFGASKMKLINQVVTENLLFSFLGGLVGVLISYSLIVLSSEWFISSQIFYSGGLLSSDSGITPGMLFNVEVFIWAFVAILLVNLFSATIPAYKYTRKSIIETLFETYKN